MTTVFRNARARMLGASFLAIAALGAAGSAASQSDDSDASRSVRVSYADLDLSYRAGASEAFARIRAAARRVCGGDEDIRILARQALSAHCQTQSIARAVDALHAPLVDSMAGHPEASVIAGR